MVFGKKNLGQSLNEGCLASMSRIPYTFLMNNQTNRVSSSKLALLSAYAGVETIEEALQVPRAARLLWLEILVNEQLDLTVWKDRPEVQEAYSKACRWYTTYRSVLNAILSRTPLPHDAGPIDFREYRTFAEALRFVAPHS